MKIKLKEALKTEYANLGLSDKAFDGVTALLLTLKTITDENEIATIVKGAEIKGMLTAIQSEGDKARQEKAALAQQLEAYKLTHPETQTNSETNHPASTSPPDATGAITLEAITSTISSLLAPLKDKFAEIEKEKKTSSVLLQAVKQRDSLKLDKSMQTWIDDAWEYATVITPVSDQDTSEVIIDRFKSRYDTVMSKLGSKGYIPAESAGGVSKSKTQELMEALENGEKNASIGVQPLKERLGLQEKKSE